MFCTCCSVDDDNERPKSTRGGKRRDEKLSEAVVALIEDIKSGGDKIPTFEWRFRRGFGGHPIGSGIIAVARVFESSGGHVTTLELQNQKIGDEGCATICEALASSPSLTALNLTKNGIGPEGVADMASTLGRCASLTKLLIEDNPLGADGPACVFDTALAAPRLAALDVGVSSDSALSPKSIRAFDSLMIASKLKHLKLSSKSAVFNDPAQLFRSIAKSTSLEELLVIGTFGETIGPAVAADCISNLEPLLTKSPPLRLLELQVPLGNEGGRALASRISHGATVAEIKVSKCKIGRAGMSDLLVSLSNNKSIEKLNVSLQGTTESLDGCMNAFVDALSTNTTLVDFNAVDLPMEDSTAERLIEVLETSMSPLKNLRHASFPSDRLLTRLSNILAEREQHLASRVAAKPVVAPVPVVPKPVTASVPGVIPSAVPAAIPAAQPAVPNVIPSAVPTAAPATAVPAAIPEVAIAAEPLSDSETPGPSSALQQEDGHGEVLCSPSGAADEDDDDDVISEDGIDIDIDF